MNINVHMDNNMFKYKQKGRKEDPILLFQKHTSFIFFLQLSSEKKNVINK